MTILSTAVGVLAEAARDVRAYHSPEGQLARTARSRDRWRNLARNMATAWRRDLRRIGAAYGEIEWYQAQNLALRGDLDRALRKGERQQVEIEDLRHELMLARRHVDTCRTAQAIADFDHDQAVSNR